MTVQKVFAGGELFAVSGVGYTPQGEISRDGATIEAHSNVALMECLKAGLLCNDAALSQTAQGWQAAGDPTEAALIAAARKAGLDPEPLKEHVPRLDAIPFESQHQYMATLHDAGSGQRTARLFERLGGEHRAAFATARSTKRINPRPSTPTPFTVGSTKWPPAGFACWRLPALSCRPALRRSGIGNVAGRAQLFRTARHDRSAAPCGCPGGSRLPGGRYSGQDDYRGSCGHGRGDCRADRPGWGPTGQLAMGNVVTGRKLAELTDTELIDVAQEGGGCSRGLPRSRSCVWWRRCNIVVRWWP